MAQQGKQMRGGACEGFPYNSIKLVSKANGNRYKVDLNTFLEALKLSRHLKYLPVQTLIFQICICSLWLQRTTVHSANFYNTCYCTQKDLTPSKEKKIFLQ